MKFKMRILHDSPAGNAEKIADAIAKAQSTTTDRIPPAYPIENERLLFIGIELKGSSADKAVSALCKDLNPSRVKNVAFYAVASSSFAAVNELKEIVKAKGINVIDNAYECTVKSGLFKAGKVTDQDVQGAVAWANKVVDSLLEA